MNSLVTAFSMSSQIKKSGFAITAGPELVFITNNNSETIHSKWK
jgi:hypothetical protein